MALRRKDPARIEAYEVFRKNRQDAMKLLLAVGQKRLDELLRGAHDDLLKKIVKWRGNPDAFTLLQLKTTMAQIRLVSRTLSHGIRGTVLDSGIAAADKGAGYTVDYLLRADKQFRGVGPQPLALREAAMIDAGVYGVRSSILSRLASSGEPVTGADEKPHRAKVGILQRYNTETIGFFERRLQRGLLARKSHSEMEEDLREESPFLRQAPAHWARRIVRTECLPGSMTVSGAVVRAVFRRRYKGLLTKIFTKHGRELTATPNHPVLTRRGWVSANEIRQGDYLVCDGGEKDSCTSGNQNVATPQASLAQIFDALATVAVGERRAGSKPDFHGDGTDEDVDVLRPHRVLIVGDFAPLVEPRTQLLFSPSNASRPSFCSHCTCMFRGEHTCFQIRPQSNSRCDEPGCDGAFACVYGCGDGSDADSTRVSRSRIDHIDIGSCSWMPRMCESQKCSVSAGSYDSISVCSPLDCVDPDAGSFRSCRKGNPLSDEIERASDLVLGVTVANRFDSRAGHSRGVDDIQDPAIAYSEAPRNYSRAKPGNVEVDRVTSVVVVEFQGFVYNLETIDGYYAVDGVYTGNCHAAYSKASWETIREADKELGDMVKILSAVFDDRTAADSYAVHGQIRRPEEPFEWWDGDYMHPPNRPNDREIVVPHRIAWPIPKSLAWRDESEIAAAWKKDGHKGSPPDRPLMTTVPLASFGQGMPEKKLPPKEEQTPEERHKSR